MIGCFGAGSKSFSDSGSSSQASSPVRALIHWESESSFSFVQSVEAGDGADRLANPIPYLYLIKRGPRYRKERERVYQPCQVVRG